jgi:hypothetical protein
MGWLRRRYGAGPLHLLSLLASFALAGYVATRIFGSARWGWILVWFAGAVIGHDLVLWPLYALVDRSAIRLARRHPERLPPVPWINHLRVPAIISGVLLTISFPLVLQLEPGTYRAATGLTSSPYLGRWLAVTGVLFAASALLYAVRLGRVVRREKNAHAGQTTS